MILMATAVDGSATGGAVPRPAAGLLLVANKGDHTLGIVDPVAGRQVAAVEESGVTGHEVAVSPDGRRAYVPIYGDAGVGRPGTDGRTIDVIDLVARRVVATIDLGGPERPHAPHFGPDGRLYVTTELSDGRVAYVACDASHQVAVIDLERWTVERLIEAGPMADGLAWAPPPR